jgi:hypothetical protein
MNAVDLIPTKRDNLAGLAGDIERVEAIFATWDETQRGAVEAYRRAVEELNGEALRRLVRALKADPAALDAMKQAVTDEVVYAVLRRHNILKPSLSERVEAALDGVRPMLASHGGDVEQGIITCPHHGFQYDLSSGECLTAPEVALQSHAVRVIGNRVEVRLSS